MMDEDWGDEHWALIAPLLRNTNVEVDPEPRPAYPRQHFVGASIRCPTEGPTTKAV
jgi:hypothetical protein